MSAFFGYPALFGGKEKEVVDLFRDIPEEQIAVVLENIRENLEKVSLYEGHTIRKHVDIQLDILRTTTEQIHKLEREFDGIVTENNSTKWQMTVRVPLRKKKHIHSFRSL